uniref:Uncharacterized protein n=1 Tax=Plectus sambesii TaxID=2011161 RepID=A0A914UI24_9BILA
MSRYEMVEEPDPMELEGDVYNPDQSCSDTVAVVGGSSVRSLEPIIAGPIGLKTVFYDPRCTPSQRRLCMGTLICVCVFCFIVLIALFVGLAKVLSEISTLEEASKHGVYMIPDLRQHQDMSFIYSKKADPKLNQEDIKRRQQYIDEIDAYLEKYDTEQKKRAQHTTNCAPGVKADNKFCNFDWRTQLGNECTKEKHYGYHNGMPCILFAFRDMQTWTPKIKGSKNDSLPFSCRAQYQYSYAAYANISYYPTLDANIGGGGFFDVNLIPARSISNSDGTPVEQDGNVLYQLPPLVMVQIGEPPTQRIFSIDCRIRKTAGGTVVENYEENKGTSGNVDIVVCNAAVLFMKYILDMKDNELQSSVDVNIMGCYNTIRAFLGPMMERNKGQIVTMSSIAGFYGETYGAAYCATKFALRGIMESVEMELYDKGLDGVYCTTICPYFTRTPMILSRNMRPTST